MHERKKINCNGFSIVESLVGIAVFIIIALTIYRSYITIMNVVHSSHLIQTAAALADEQFEIIRNLPYADVGLVHGLPQGKIEASRTIVRNNASFTVNTVIRNIDDPFDGTLGGAPNDLSPADSKLVEVEISCPTCKYFSPLYFTTRVAPKNLENASTNGSLFIRVFDANGQPVPSANVHVENNTVVPAISIDDTTNNNGLLQIVDAPPGVEVYQITVTKPGYSQDRTYPTGAVGNPNPTKPNATVILQQVTQVSFIIDKISTMAFSSVTDTCAPVGDVEFSLAGSKLIGTLPDVLKYSGNFTTDGSGSTTISNLEWDNYNISITDAAYDLAGSIPLVPVNLIPNTTQDMKFIVTPKNPSSLLITVKDASTQLPLADTSVIISKGAFTSTLVTGRGFLRQTDWSGGDGQSDFLLANKYFSADGNLDTASPTGELLLVRDIIAGYAPNGELISSTFDTGSASNFYQISWEPQNQPPETGSDNVRLQLAANNDKTTWNFSGPDGTAGTYYTLANMNISAALNGNRYIRYKIFLQTADSGFSPNISDVAFTFTSACVPPGQVIFKGLEQDTYNISATKANYQVFNDIFSLDANWKQTEITLIPQ